MKEQPELIGWQSYYKARRDGNRRQKKGGPIDRNDKW